MQVLQRQDKVRGPEQTEAEVSAQEMSDGHSPQVRIQIFLRMSPESLTELIYRYVENSSFVIIFLLSIISV